MENYTVVKDTTKLVRRFGLRGRALEFKIKPIPADKDPVIWIKDAIEQIVERSVSGLEATDKVGFTFCSKDFTRGEGWTRFKNAEEVTFDSVWKLISSIYQSNSSGLSTETFCLKTTAVRMPTGKGRGGLYNTFEEECRMRKGIICIKNEDNLCLPRALVVAMSHTTKDPEHARIRRDRQKLQTIRTHQLLKDSGVVIPAEGAGIPELKQLQAHLTGYTIIVYNYGSKGREVIFRGHGGPKKLNLLCHDGHYNVITSLTATFACDYFCEDCSVAYNTKERHRCGGTCPCCSSTPPCPTTEPTIKCTDCNRSFRGETCYTFHKSKMCAQIRRCDSCLKTIKTGREHTCGEVFCKVCKKHKPEGHLCYIQPDNRQPTFKDMLFVFYDLETRQEKKHGDSLLHTPNLCVFKQCCDQCIDTELEICKKCGVRLQKIYCSDVISPFVHHIMTIRKKFKTVVVMGHNAGGFDHQFLLHYILTQTDITPELIMRGTKLIVMTTGNVKFLDSLNYFPMALAKLPTVFGFTELKKGYFPHLFNKAENENYVGPLPAVEYYDSDNMKTEDRQKFLQWHEELSKTEYVFDFQKEIVEYCISDVEILTRACLEFRKLLLESGNVCPYTEATTLPSACNKIYRRNFLEPNTVGIIPKGGYRWRDNQSIVAIQWLVWEEQQRGINIEHAAKDREAMIHGVKVDGYCVESRQIFEFHGCYYHGCPRCFPYDRDSPCHDNPSITMYTRYGDTLEKTARLRASGYEVVEKWECDFRNEMTEEMKVYVENHELLRNTPLNPRDAFYGGRTGASKLYHRVAEGEKIKYVDVCSLYPYTNKYGKYPVGHPKVYVGEDCQKLDLQTTEGLIKCKILPPQDLYHPVLPVKQNHKLMFSLCRTCSEQLNQGECTHTQEQRALCGTWVVDEVRKAIEKGYTVLETYEVWEYQIVKGLFKEYIDEYLKIKQQASGWPAGCDNSEEKQKYIQQYLEKEGVQLNPDKIEKNPGLRQVGKAVITSFWGKFGQRENQQKTSIVNKPETFFSMLANPAVNINTVQPVNENVVVVGWEYKEETVDPLPTVNVVLAAYTTAQARLKLYSYLEQLDERVLYYDTDSVIYVSRSDEWDVPLGSFLGEMTDELECYGEGSYITTFASGGPKLYTYRVFSPAKDKYYDTIKVKGITINYNTSKTVNFESLCGMVLEETEPKYITTKNIRRTADHDVVTCVETKVFRPTFSKRKRVENYDSIPYGYKRVKQ